MLVKQSFRVHQIIPHIAKKEKRLYLFNLQKLIVLHFDDNNQKENLFGVNQDFTINKLIMQIKVLDLISFYNWNFERLQRSSFWFMFQYSWKELHYLLPQLHSEAKKILSRRIYFRSC